MYEFKKDNKGIHQLGGIKPNDLVYPKNEFLSNFQYIGLINRTDEVFNWIPFNLHLICPVYLNIEKVFLNYNNPQIPKLISPKDTAKIDSEYDELTIDSLIQFEATRFKVEKVNQIDEMECLGITGNPACLNGIETPICPISKKRMKFVCQIMTFGEIPVKMKNFESEYSDFEHMCFWGDGSLFVFMEPETKTVCYFIENT
ncbi:MAG: hypothetical protein ACEPOW_14705 [Bacteroidales bacterium]